MRLHHSTTAVASALWLWALSGCSVSIGSDEDDETAGSSGNSSDASGSSDDGADGSATGTDGSGSRVDGPPEAPSSSSAFTCDGIDRGVGGVPAVRGRVASQSWSGRVYVSGDLRLDDGQTLTIEPGTTVIVAFGATLFIDEDGASVEAVGTEEAPIRFCGEGDAPGSWQRLQLDAVAGSESTLEHVVIADAGDGESESLRVYGQPLLRNVLVENAGGPGVRARAFGEGSEQLTVRGAAGYPVVALAEDALGHLPLGGSLEGNETDGVLIDFGTFNVDTELRDPGVPYVLSRSTSVRAALSVDPGLEFLAPADAGLAFGNGFEGSAFLQGTPEAPITFRGLEETPGFWRGLLVDGDTTTDSTFRNVVVRHAGAEDQFALRVDAPVTLDGIRISDSTRGFSLSPRGLGGASGSIEVTASTEIAVQVAPAALLSLPAGLSIVDNQDDAIVVEGGAIDDPGTIVNHGVPYRLTGSFNVRSGDLTIEAGTHFVAESDALVLIDGIDAAPVRVTVAGTELAPIRFTGLEETPGYWSGIRIGSDVSTESVLDWVEVAHAAGPCLTTFSNVSIVNSSFHDCETLGVATSQGDPPDYEGTNTFENLPAGNVGGI